MLTIPLGDLSVTTRKVENPIDDASEPTPETAAPVVHPPADKEWASNESEEGYSETQAIAEPLPPEQLSSPIDLTETAAVTVQIERASSIQGGACTEADSVPKLTFWARIKRLVVGR